MFFKILETRRAEVSKMMAASRKLDKFTLFQQLLYDHILERVDDLVAPKEQKESENYLQEALVRAG